MTPRLAAAGATDPTFPRLSFNGSVLPSCLTLRFFSSRRVTGKQTFCTAAPLPLALPAEGDRRVFPASTRTLKGRSHERQTALLGWETPFHRGVYECERTDVHIKVGFCVSAVRNTRSMSAYGNCKGNPFSLSLLNPLSLSGVLTLSVRPVTPFVPPGRDRHSRVVDPAVSSRLSMVPIGLGRAFEALGVSGLVQILSLQWPAGASMKRGLVSLHCVEDAVPNLSTSSFRQRWPANSSSVWATGWKDTRYKEKLVLVVFESSRILPD